MSGPNRVILGFYAGEDEYAQKVWSAIRSITPRVQYFRSHGESQTPKPFSSRYAVLRLSDKALIVAEVERDRLPSVLNILRTSGGAALFVARQKGTTRSDGISAEGAPDIQSWHTGLKRLAVYEAITRETRADLLEANRLEHTVTESAKWLIDNDRKHPELRDGKRSLFLILFDRCNQGMFVDRMVRRCDYALGQFGHLQSAVLCVKRDNLLLKSRGRARRISAMLVRSK